MNFETNGNQNNYNRYDHSKERPSPLRVVHDRKPAVDIIAGRNPVMEALRSGRIIEKVVILAGVKGTAIEKIRQMARRNRVPCIEVGKMKFRDLVSDTTTQGVVAIVGTKKYAEMEDIFEVAKSRGEQPFILFLDEIEDPQNLGALIRTAECAGVHGAVIPKHHAATVNQTVAKTSAGASEHLLVAKVTNLANTLDELKKKGLWVVGTDSDAEKLYTELDYTTPIALVVGNEGKGVRHLVKEKCDFVVKIPLFGKVESLNASVAGALVMYEAVKQRRNLAQQIPNTIVRDVVAEIPGNGSAAKENDPDDNLQDIEENMESEQE